MKRNDDSSRINNLAQKKNKQALKKRAIGFSLLEISMSLVIAGVLAGIGLPIAGTYVEHYKHTQDKVNIQKLNQLIIGYAMSRGGFPDPDVGDILPSTNVGMRGKNSYNMDIQYYANALLTETATAQDFTTLCDTAREILDGTTVSTTPAICNDVDESYVNCTDSTVMAFVIVSPGKNRAMEHENGDGDSEFENPTKRPNETNEYDDVLASYGIPALVSECQKI